MKAYIHEQLSHGPDHGPAKWFASVVSEQDYHAGGPFSRSYRTPEYDTPAQAIQDACRWALANGYAIVTGPEKF